LTSIEFCYNGNNIIIQCNKNDKIKDIINKYILNLSIDKNSVNFFYSGNKINEELELQEIIGNEEKIKILVLDSKEDINNNKSLIKSKYIICPKCGENIKYKFSN